MLPLTLDAETRELLGEVRTQLAEGNKVKAAVQQIEEQLKTLPQTIESKLSAIRRSIYDPRTGKERGRNNFPASGLVEIEPGILRRPIVLASRTMPCKRIRLRPSG